MRRNITTVFLVLTLLLQLACSQSQINRAVNIASTVPGIIATFPIGNKQKVLEVADLIISGLKTFRDNPTASNYQSAMKVIEDALNSGIFNFNPLVRSVFNAVKVLLAAIVPESDAGMAGDEKVNVKDIRRADVDDLEVRVKALKESAK